MCRVSANTPSALNVPAEIHTPVLTVYPVWHESGLSCVGLSGGLRNPDWWRKEKKGVFCGSLNASCRSPYTDLPGIGRNKKKGVMRQNPAGCNRW